MTQVFWTFSLAMFANTHGESERTIRTAEIAIASANETLPYMAMAVEHTGHIVGPVLPQLHGTDTQYRVHFGYDDAIPAQPSLSMDADGRIVFPCLMAVVHQRDWTLKQIIERTDQRMDDYITTMMLDHQLSTN